MRKLLSDPMTRHNNTETSYKDFQWVEDVPFSFGVKGQGIMHWLLKMVYVT